MNERLRERLLTEAAVIDPPLSDDWIPSSERACATLMRMAAERIAELEKDAQRMDWLEANDPADIQLHTSEPPERRWFDFNSRAPVGRDHFPTLRALIDAALHQRKENEEDRS